MDGKVAENLKVMSTVGTDGELVRVQLPSGGSCGYLKGPGSGRCEQAAEERKKFWNIKWKDGG